MGVGTFVRKECMRMSQDIVDYKAVGRRIREHRVDRQLTQKMLAEMVQVSTSYIGHLERAEKKPSLETIVSLCQCLNVDTDELVLGRKNRCHGDCPLFTELKALLQAHGMK